MFQVEKPGIPLHVRQSHATHATEFRASRLFMPPAQRLPDTVTFGGAPQKPGGASYTRKERLGFAFQAIRHEIKKSWLMKLDLACGPLCLLSILVPHMFPLSVTTACLFTTGVVYSLLQAREAYKSPETFLKNLKKPPE